MLDCSDLLPELLELAKLAEDGPTVSTEEVQARLTAAESKMFPRAFRWVAKSGGTSVPVSCSSKELTIHTCTNYLT